MRERAVLCEGFDDRAFWKGLVRRAHFTDATTDPKGLDVKGGDFGFRRGDIFLRIRPSQGKTKLFSALQTLITRTQEHRPERVLLSFDMDGETFGDPGAWVSQRLRSIPSLARAEQTAGHSHVVTLPGGPIRIDACAWQSRVVDEHVPRQQTLERLVCAALARLHPDRARSVAEWLRTEPACTSPDDPKAHAYAHLAKWHADMGCTRFYEAAWEDEALAGALEHLLREAGSWQAIDQFLAE